MTVTKSTETLERLRNRLRVIDDEIIFKIMERMDIVRDIGRLKNEQGLEIYDAARESFNRGRSREISSGKLPPEMSDQVTDLLAQWARDFQVP